MQTLARRTSRLGASLAFASGLLASTAASALPIEITDEAFHFTGAASLPFGDGFAPVDTNIELTESASQTSTMDINATIDTSGFDPAADPITSFTIDSTVDVTLYPVLRFTTANPGDTFGGTLGDTIEIAPASPLTASSVDQTVVDLSGTPGDGQTLLNILFMILNGDLTLTDANLTTTNVSSTSDPLDFSLPLGQSIGGDPAENDILKASVTGFTLGGVPLDADTLLASQFDPSASPAIPELTLNGSISDLSQDPPFGPIILQPVIGAAVPEPATLVLAAVGLLAALAAPGRRLLAKAA